MGIARSALLLSARRVAVEWVVVEDRRRVKIILVVVRPRLRV